MRAVPPPELRRLGTYCFQNNHADREGRWHRDWRAANRTTDPCQALLLGADQDSEVRLRGSRSCEGRRCS